MSAIQQRSSFVTPSDRTPFELLGRGPACLLLHGFLGDTREMRPLAHAIHQQLGYHVYAPLWPGHGVPPQELAGLGIADFIKAGQTALNKLRTMHSQVVVCAYSMGGALAVKLIAEQPVAGFVTLAPMLSIRNPLLPLAPLTRFVLPWIYPLKTTGADAMGLRKAALTYYPELDPNDPSSMEQLKNTFRFPLPITDELRKMQRVARLAARHLHIPTLILTGDTDFTLDPSGSSWLYEHLPAADKTFFSLPGAGHDLVKPENIAHDRIITLVIDWLRARFA
jgi:esterase/lipase